MLCKQTRVHVVGSCTTHESLFGAVYAEVKGTLGLGLRELVYEKGLRQLVIKCIGWKGFLKV